MSWRKTQLYFTPLKNPGGQQPCPTAEVHGCDKSTVEHMDDSLLALSKLFPKLFPLPAPPLWQFEFTLHKRWPGTSIDCDI